MNLKERIIKHLKLREGKRLTVYKDSLGKLTVGVGHLVRPQDNLKLGDKITNERCNAFLEEDMATAFKAALDQAKEIGKHSDDFVLALTSVNFQLGTGWPEKFYSSYPKLVNGDWQGAIEGFKSSKWAKQTPVRVDDFVKAIEIAYNQPLTEKPKGNTPMSKTTTEPKAGVKTSEFWLTIVTGIITFVVTLVNEKFGLGISPTELLAAISPLLTYIFGRPLVKIFGTKTLCLAILAAGLVAVSIPRSAHAAPPVWFLLGVPTVGWAAVTYEECKEDGLDAKECAKRTWDERDPVDYDRLNK